MNKFRFRHAIPLGLILGTLVSKNSVYALPSQSEIEELTDTIYYSDEQTVTSIQKQEFIDMIQGWLDGATPHEIVNPDGETLGESVINFKSTRFRLAYKIQPSKSTIHITIPSQSKTLEVIDFESHDFENCFDFSVSTGTRLAELHILNSGIDCGLPKDKTGGFLMELMDKIAVGLSVKTVSLIDISEITCKSSKSSRVSLPFYYMMKNGQTWYEKYGFYPKNVNESNYRDIKKKLINFSLEQIHVELELLSKNLRKHIKRKAPKFNTFHAFISNFNKNVSNKGTLSEFIVWMWDNHCDKFNDIISTLFSEESVESVTYFEWDTLMKKFKDASVIVKKEYEEPEMFF